MRLFLWIIYFFSGFFPRKNYIYGTYYENHYSNSFQFFLTQKKGKFICKNPTYFQNDSIYLYSIKSFYYHITAKVVYVDYSRQDILWFLTRGAKVINLWHGMPIKKIEKDIDSGPLKIKYSKSIKDLFIRLLFHPYTFLKYEYVLVNSELHLSLLSNAFNTNKLILGKAPRLNLWHKNYKKSKNKSIWFTFTFSDDGTPPMHILEVLNLKIDGYSVNCVLHPKDINTYKLYSKIGVIHLGLDVSIVGPNDIIVSEQSSLLFDASIQGLKIFLIKSKNLRNQYLNISDYFEKWAIVEHPRELGNLNLNSDLKTNCLIEKNNFEC